MKNVFYLRADNARSLEILFQANVEEETLRNYAHIYEQYLTSQLIELETTNDILKQIYKSNYKVAPCQPYKGPIRKVLFNKDEQGYLKLISLEV